MVKNNIVSIEYDLALYMSLMNIKNNKGASTVPCGTPERTSDGELCLLSRITLVNDYKGNSQSM